MHAEYVLNAFYSWSGMLNKSLFCHFFPSKGMKNMSLHGVHCCWHGVLHVAIYTTVSSKSFVKTGEFFFG